MYSRHVDQLIEFYNAAFLFADTIPENFRFLITIMFPPELTLLDKILSGSLTGALDFSVGLFGFLFFLRTLAKKRLKTFSASFIGIIFSSPVLDKTSIFSNSSPIFSSLRDSIIFLLRIVI